jgi:hypothetical protein
VSLNVLILAEDPVRDGYVLKPIVEAMMKAVGKPQAYVEVCKDPRFRGTGQALKWEFVREALARNEGMFHLYLLCVDRDGEANRQAKLTDLEKKAKKVVGDGCAFLAENAWQEVEVWLLMGHELPRKWDWRKIREEIHPKERYYQPFAESRGALDLPDEGRDELARKAAARYGQIRGRCKEDVQRLEDRIREWIGNRE